VRGCRRDGDACLSGGDYYDRLIFVVISRALGVIHGLEGIEFQIRTFYDVSGTGGRVSVVWLHLIADLSVFPQAHLAHEI